MSSIHDFIPLTKLGEGAFSTVYKVRRLSDQKIYALKKVRMKNLTVKQKQNALNEIRILASLECRTIVTYKEAFFDQKLNILCIVMEFADQGDLQKYIQEAKKKNERIPEIKIWQMIADVLVALTHLHSKGILHRDLKSANIFINSLSNQMLDSSISGPKRQMEVFKLGDLNVSKVNSGNLAYTQTGTPYYASPQVWRDEPYDHKSDIWSFGCIIYEMTCFKPPFQGLNMEDLFNSVQKKQFKPIPDQYSYQIADIIDRCLLKQARNRPTSEQLLQHIIVKKFVNLRQKIMNFNNDQKQEFDGFQYIPISQQKQKENLIQDNKRLLDTIKLPVDLGSLQNKLPAANYDNDRKKGLKKQEILKKIFKEPQRYTNHQKLQFVSDRFNNHQNLQGERKNQKKNKNQKTILQDNEKLLKNQSTVEKKTNLYQQSYLSPKAKANRSQVYTSPKNIKRTQQNIASYKSPEDYPLSRNSSAQKLNQLYSDRKLNIQYKLKDYLCSSEKKPSYQHYSASRQKLDQSRKKGVPRTQKRNISGHICSQEQPIQQLVSNYKKMNDVKVIEDWKKKLVKKSRVMSNNNHLKHYYAYPY